MNPMIYDDYKKKFLYNTYEKSKHPKGDPNNSSKDFIIIECKRTFYEAEPRDNPEGYSDKSVKCCNLFNQYKEEFMKKGIDLNKIINAENCK